MKHPFAPVSLLMLLTACSPQVGAPDRAKSGQSDAEAIAAVKAAQTPAPLAFDLSPIVFADIERENMFGAGCSFSEGSVDNPDLALAQANIGFLKIDGRIVRFAPDAGSARLPYKARAKYASGAHSFRLTADTGRGTQSGTETTDYPGRLTISDAYDRIVYDRTGTVQCGA